MIGVVLLKVTLDPENIKRSCPKALPAVPATAGTGAAAVAGTAGSGFGQDLFMFSGSSVTFNNTTPITFSNPIQSDQNAGGGGTGGGVTISGTGHVSFAGTNTYTGTPGTTINNGGYLVLPSGASILTFPTINSGGTFDLSAQAALTLVPTNLATATSNGTIVIPNSPVITSVTATSAITYNGILSGTGAVSFTGTNPVALNGLNNYTGGTTIGTGIALTIGASGALASTGAVGIVSTGSLTISSAQADRPVKRNRQCDPRRQCLDCQ